MPTLPLSILPKTKSPEDFELICRDVLTEKCNIEFKLYGRNGQRQNGIDLFAQEKDGSLIVAQCKNYCDENKADTLIKKMESDIKKINDIYKQKEDEAKNKKGEKKQIKKVFLMTSYNTDTKIQDFSIGCHNKYLFEIEILFWEDIEEIILDNDSILKRYYPYKKSEKNLITLFEFAFVAIQFSYLNFLLSENRKSKNVCYDMLEKGKVWIKHKSTKKKFSDLLSQIPSSTKNKIYDADGYLYERDLCVEIENMIKGKEIYSKLSSEQKDLFSMGKCLGNYNKECDNEGLPSNIDLEYFMILCDSQGFMDEQNQEIKRLLEPMLNAPSQEIRQEERQESLIRVYDYIRYIKNQNEISSSHKIIQI